MFFQDEDNIIGTNFMPYVQNAAGLTGASNAQNSMFSVVRHEWPIESFMRGADMISVVEFACLESLDAFLPSAGRTYRMQGDYA
ncbi:MAG: hypothetical protein ABIR36_11255 [Nitrospiraceae bacterium]